ncbi:hypothetical protein GN956_G16870 [Arapaima gigas]
MSAETKALSSGYIDRTERQAKERGNKLLRLHWLLQHNKLYSRLDMQLQAWKDEGTCFSHTPLFALFFFAPQKSGRNQLEVTCKNWHTERSYAGRSRQAANHCETLSPGGHRRNCSVAGSHPLRTRFAKSLQPVRSSLPDSGKPASSSLRPAASSKH